MAVEAATNATIHKGAVGVAPMSMFQVLRPYIPATALSHTTLNPGLVRALRDEKVITMPEDNGKDDMKEYRKEWKKGDKKARAVEEETGKKVAARLESLKLKQARVVDVSN